MRGDEKEVSPGGDTVDDVYEAALLKNEGLRGEGIAAVKPEYVEKEPFNGKKSRNWRKRRAQDRRSQVSTKATNSPALAEEENATSAISSRSISPST